MSQKKKSDELAYDLIDSLLEKTKSKGSVRRQGSSSKKASEEDATAKTLRWKMPFKGKEKNTDDDNKTIPLASSSQDATRPISPQDSERTAAIGSSPPPASNEAPGLSFQERLKSVLNRNERAASSGGIQAMSELHLAQSEGLKIAQERILELEREVDRTRRENEQLAAAGETLQRRLDQLSAHNENLKLRQQESQERFSEDRKIMRDSVHAQSKEKERLKLKVEELEMRLANDLKKIRVRERELENRLEILKMESAALVRSKDETILELKREIDQLMQETDNYRLKSQELHRTIQNNEERFRRTVRALRLALSMLESDDEGQGDG